MINLNTKLNELNKIIDKITASKVKDNLREIYVSSQYFSNEQDILNIYLITKTEMDENINSDLEIELAEICLPFTPFIISSEQFKETYGERSSQLVWQCSNQT